MREVGSLEIAHVVHQIVKDVTRLPGASEHQCFAASTGSVMQYVVENIVCPGTRDLHHVAVGGTVRCGHVIKQVAADDATVSAAT